MSRFLGRVEFLTRREGGAQGGRGGLGLGGARGVRVLIVECAHSEFKIACMVYSAELIDYIGSHGGNKFNSFRGAHAEPLLQAEYSVGARVSTCVIVALAGRVGILPSFSLS